MPTVGKRTFPYDKKGEAAAASFAAKTGQKETVKKGDEGLPFIPKAGTHGVGGRKPGMGDEGKPLKPGRPGRGDEGMKMKKKVPKKPPRRMK